MATTDADTANRDDKLRKGQPMTMTETEFETWMAKVDANVNTRTGLSVYDLPDMAFREMADDGETPSGAAEAALTEAGW